MWMLGGKTRWIATAVLFAAAGCNMTPVEQPQLMFWQMPPAVQAAFTANYPKAIIQNITCESKGGQYNYVITYQGEDVAPSDHPPSVEEQEAAMKAKHTVTLNEAGDQIAKH